MNDQPFKDLLDSKCFKDTILVLRSKLTTDQATLMTSIRINVWNTVLIELMELHHQENFRPLLVHPSVPSLVVVF